jgi:hypothetical protein
VNLLTEEKQRILELILSWPEEAQKDIIKVIEQETKTKFSEIKDFNERLQHLSKALEEKNIDLNANTEKRYPDNISMI